MVELDGYDANNYEPQSFDTIPSGDYDAVITESELKDTKAGDGQYLKLTLQILSGEYANRKLWDILNLKNKNPKAVEIAKGTLSSICRAVETMTPKDSADLHNKPLLIAVGVEAASGGYNEKNKIVGYRKLPVGMSPAAVKAEATDTPASDDIPF